MNTAIRRELDRLNEAPMASGETRRAVFEATERPALQPLPANPWEWGEWVERKVGPNGHVRVEHIHNSVPESHIGRSVAARVGERMVEVFLEHGGERIAVHRRRSGRNQYATNPAHMPDPSPWRKARPTKRGAEHRRVPESPPPPPCQAADAAPALRCGLGGQNGPVGVGEVGDGRKNLSGHL